jgi:hypothetical protein
MLRRLPTCWGGPISRFLAFPAASSGFWNGLLKSTISDQFPKQEQGIFLPAVQEKPALLAIPRIAESARGPV